MNPSREDRHMPNFLSKRLQVFVSSTYTDLKDERQAAVEAILTAGHIPAGMELFTAGDESQMDVIKQWIDDFDVYLLILGGRYGTLEPKTGQSYIELEYRYALDKRKALFACVAKETQLEERVKRRGSEVLERDNPQKLRESRTFVLTKMVRFWDDYKDIKIAVGETLSDFARRDEFVGWVRGDQGTNPAVTDELARLSKENAELREQLAEGGGPTLFQGLSDSRACPHLDYSLPGRHPPDGARGIFAGPADAHGLPVGWLRSSLQDARPGVPNPPLGRRRRRRLPSGGTGWLGPSG